MNKEKRRISAGWAETDITPLKPAVLHGQFYDRLSTGTRDPLKAVVLAISAEDDSDCAIIVSCDLCVIYRASRELLIKKLKDKAPWINGDMIQLSATHIHTGPYQSTERGLMGNLAFRWAAHYEGVITPEEYTDYFTDKVRDAVILAWENRKPAGISAKLAYAVTAHNRRSLYDDNTVKMYGKSDSPSYMGPEGPDDTGVELLYFFNESKKLTGVIVNAAVPAQVMENRCFFTADIWGEVRKLVRSKYGVEVFVLPLCGAAGDLAPRDTVRRNRGTSESVSEEWMGDIAKRLVWAVDSRFEKAQADISDTNIFMHTVLELSLPVRTVLLAEYQTQKAIYEQLVKKYELDTKYLDKEKLSPGDHESLYISESAVAIYERRKTDPIYDIKAHFIRIGNIAMTSNPFELFSTYGLIIKARSKAVQTFIAQLSDDTAGYLATEKAQSGGGYSGMTASGFIGPDGGRLLVEYCVNHINDMFE